MQIEAFFQREDLSLNGKTLVVATSGGPDSMALLDLLNNIKTSQNFHLIAAHLDHQLRQDSQREAEVIDRYCQDKQIKTVHGSWPQSIHPQNGTEAAARKYRYDFLAQVMQANAGDYLLTAHHCDDLVENILIKFIRSGNPSEMNSLTAVSKWRGALLLRPLLSIEKETLLVYDRGHDIPFVIDKSNKEDTVLRNRLRHQVVPMLKRENTQLGQNALRFSRQISQMTTLIETEFSHLEQPQSFLGLAFRLPQAALANLSPDQQTAYWQNFIWHKQHVRVNENLGSMGLITYQGYFYLLPKRLPPAITISPITVEHEFSFGPRRFLLTTTKCQQGQLLDHIFLPQAAKLNVGSLLAGKKLLLKNGQHAKSKKKFAQAKIPAALRPYCLTLYEDGKVEYIEHVYCKPHNSDGLQKYYLYVSN